MMIAEFFSDLGMNIAIWITTLFPEWEIPEWVHDSRGTLLGLLQTHSGLGVWVDWGVLGLCITATATTYGVMLLVKLIRAALGHVPQVGGKGD